MRCKRTRMSCWGETATRLSFFQVGTIVLSWGCSTLLCALPERPVSFEGDTRFYMNSRHCGDGRHCGNTRLCMTAAIAGTAALGCPVERSSTRVQLHIANAVSTMYLFVPEALLVIALRFNAGKRC
jgi:hypothetical protein